MENSSPPAQQQPVQFESAFKLFGPSIHIIVENLGTFILLFVIYFVPAIISFGMAMMITSSDMISIVSGSIALIVGIIYIFYVAPLIGASLIYTQLNGVRDKKVSVGDALKGAQPFVFKILGLAIILLVVFVVSFLLFIVPFFFMYKRYLLTPFFMIDKKLGIFDAMKLSAETSKKYSSEIWGVVGVTFLLGIVSSIPILGWGIGNILAILYSCAPAVRYEQINKVESGVKGIASNPTDNTNQITPTPPPPSQNGPHPTHPHTKPLVQ